MESDSLLEHDDEEIKPICGTTESAYIWCNSTDNTGLLCSSLVVISMLYSFSIILYSTITGYISVYNGTPIMVLSFLAMWSHYRTMTGDPGAVPANAHPRPCDILPGSAVSICGRCDGYKPPNSHHDRISNRCICRMDHFCPWMNNAIGAKNQKNFLLFLIYSDSAAIYIYILMALHLIDCSAIDCTEFTGVILNLVRVLIFVLLFGIIFTSSMIANQLYGLYLGKGTIDRMKKSNSGSSDKEGDFLGTSVPFTHVFGVSWITYILPLDVVFEKEEDVYNYKLRAEVFTMKAC